jgi:hypothetical protein
MRTPKSSSDVILSAAPAFGAESKDPRDVSLTILIRGIPRECIFSHRFPPKKSSQMIAIVHYGMLKGKSL